MSESTDFIIENGVLIKYTGKGGRVEIPQGVTWIKAGVFENSGIQVTSIVLPESLEHVEKSVFWWRKSLKAIVAPSKKIYNLVYNTLDSSQRMKILQTAVKSRSQDPNVVSKIVANKNKLIAIAIKNEDEETVKYILSLMKKTTAEQLETYIEMSSRSVRLRAYFLEYKQRLYPPEQQVRNVEKEFRL